METGNPKRAEDLFHDAVEVPLDQRASFLDQRCGEDAALRRDVESLLLHFEQADDAFLESPVLGDALGSAMDPPPLRIGRYEIIRKIGDGGMGVVYEARQDHPSRTVAVKLLRPGLISQSLLRRFEHEADILAQFQHRGIAHVYDAGMGEVVTDRGVAAPQPFLAMEFIRGRPLTDYAVDRKLGTRQRLELFMGICDAVQHAHEHGVIHRDLKPANILVDESGQPKVLDFGVARVTNADLATMTLQTSVGQLIGTIPYMSPEQVAADSRHIDARTDVYSLGVILYELLTGRLPYDVAHVSIPEAARIIREEDPARLVSVDIRLRGDLETIVAKVLEKDKERRYSSAAELAADVRRFLHGEPIVARPASTIYQLRKFAFRHKTLTASTALLFLVLSTFGVWMSVLYRQADRLRLAADRQAHRARLTQGFLEKMLSAIDPEVAKGKDTSLIRGILTEAVGKVGTELADQPEAEADIRATIGAAYLSVGLAQEAQTQLDAALAIRRRTQGDEHDAVAATLRLLAECAGKQGDRERAESLARQALALRRKQFGNADLKVAETLETSAWILSELSGNHTEAAAQLRESLDITERVAGRDHAQYANGLHRLAVVLWRWQRYDEAESVARETLALKQELFGMEHPSVATALELVGLVLQAKQDYAAAEPLIRESFEMHRRLFGEDHPQFATALNNLSELLVAKGDYAAAEPLHRRCLDLITRLRGEDSHETAMAWMNLAALLDKKGDSDEAQRLYRIADERFRKVFPPDHPYVHSPLTRLAKLLDKNGEHESAEPLWRQLVNETRQAFPPGHANHRIAVQKAGGLGRCLLSLRQCREAEELLAECYEAQSTNYGPHHKETMAAVKDLVRLYEQCGPAEKADGLRLILASAEVHPPGDGK